MSGVAEVVAGDGDEEGGEKEEEEGRGEGASFAKAAAAAAVAAAAATVFAAEAFTGEVRGDRAAVKGLFDVVGGGGASVGDPGNEEDADSKDDEEDDILMEGTGGFGLDPPSTAIAAGETTATATGAEGAREATNGCGGGRQVKGGGW